jgi:hypothetical protein
MNGRPRGRSRLAPEIQFLEKACIFPSPLWGGDRGGGVTGRIRRPCRDNDSDRAMHDIRAIRDNPAAFDKGRGDKGENRDERQASRSVAARS